MMIILLLWRIFIATWIIVILKQVIEVKRHNHYAWCPCWMRALDHSIKIKLYNLPHTLLQFTCFMIISQSTMKKVVLKLDLHNDKTKQKAMKTVSNISGVESVSVDMKEKKMSLNGENSTY